jgi:predicted ABC-type ATPase
LRARAAKPPGCPYIYVLAGTNGAGKSSVGGAILLKRGVEYFDPDQAAKQILAANPGITQFEANAAAWQEGKRLLQRAIAERRDLAIETTLGGRTIPARLHRALSKGVEVRIWYVGLRSPEVHISRVRSRVSKGGHNIDPEKIRERYDQSRLNLIRLLSRLTELWVYDNSAEADPSAGIAPEPILILHLAHRVLVYECELRLTPKWAKPVLAAALAL